MQHARLKWTFFPCWRTRCSITLGQRAPNQAQDMEAEKCYSPGAGKTFVGFDQCVASTNHDSGFLSRDQMATNQPEVQS